jgi:hypothetical protein
VIIKYRGGPLNRRDFTGPAQQPTYRDITGQPMNVDLGRTVAIERIHQQSRNAAYVYSAQRCEYTYVGKLLSDTATEQIRRLLDRMLEHPEEAARCEAEIRRIEGLSVVKTESAA